MSAEVRFQGSFTQQEALPQASIEAATAALKSGRLHRYNTRTPDELSETALLEREYAGWQGAKYCLACASGGQALQISMRAAGLKGGEKVLTNAFTLAPVPGAIAAVGGCPVFVEVTENLVIDPEDLVRKIGTSGARFLLLSHMRGHLADMERIVEICDKADVKIIEDCAHTMGATWRGGKSGNFGIIGCFSTQTYKHMNSGEGGVITSNDPEIMARAIILSGSYMLYERHGAAPEPKYFDQVRLETPNMSARLDNLRAAILRPQLRNLDNNIERWNERYRCIAGLLTNSPVVQLPAELEQSRRVGSSIQFRIHGLQESDAEELVQATAARGVELKWFGAPLPRGFTSIHKSWRYVDPQHLPATDAITANLFDMRIPLTFSLEDCKLIGEILLEEISRI